MKKLFLLMITIVMIAAVAFAAIPDQCNEGMIAYWEGNGDATDSFDGYHGTMGAGGGYGSGKLGQGFNFDAGADDYVKLPVIYQLPSFTIAAWVKIPYASGNNKKIFTWSDGTNFASLQMSHYFQLEYGEGDGVTTWSFIRSEKEIRDNEFHLVTVTNNNGATIIYLDGKVVGSKSISRVITTPKYVTIGAVYTGGQYNGNFHGIIDDVALYEGILSAGEIKRMYEDGMNARNYCPPCIDEDGDGSPIGEYPNCKPVDCDDEDANVYPGADEYCNEEDDNCNGQKDENAVDAATWYADSDGDEYGDAGSTNVACEMPSGYLNDDTDCNDNDASVNPGADEVYCDTIDNDCNSATIDSIDADGDGVGNCDDCNDDDATVYPGADEVYCDGVDNDCDPETIDSEDVDGDGVGYCADECPDSAVEEIKLNPNHYGQTVYGGVFEAGPGNDESLVYDMDVTKGCTCKQIAEKQGVKKGQVRNGCPASTMEQWTGIESAPDKKAGIGSQVKGKKDADVVYAEIRWLGLISLSAIIAIVIVSWVAMNRMVCSLKRK